MKLSTVLGAGAFAVAVAAADADDVAFLTALVEDFKSNKKQYVNYFQTATGVPKQLTQLAVQVATYTDESYTTLLDNSDINVGSLESFATGLPWYTRLAAEVSVASGSTTSSGLKTTSSSDNGGLSMVAPGGALLGALAIALL